ncbi:DUF4344 domain-containing metallopeptidase [Streptomyces orinoci]|uniref:DUF4344 domain-containing metallopeptidase n=1 Tax=Streptomyces orinoci TaxID=67339 RepID=A0ABV3JU19_STRON|nr:DUF4344 domain-containing metallopeptidase [Streptomyces orinoci]
MQLNATFRFPCALAVTACAVLVTGCGGKAESARPSGTGKVTVSYEEPRDDGADERPFLRRHRLPERVADDLNRTVRLPEPVQIVGRTCKGGDDYPEYDDDRGRIVLCYDYVDEIRGQFKDARDKDPDGRTAGVVTESLYHEAAHALVDKLQLPFTGREEDVADQFAAYRMIPHGAQGRDGLLAAADNYAASAAGDEDGEEFDPSDEHAPDAVRAANYRCYLYGSRPKEADRLIDGTLLTDERARGCGAEYRALRRGWDKLLAPYAR